MWRYTAAESVDQVGVHVLELIRDVQADDGLAGQLGGKLLPQSAHMPLLDHEDQIRPADVAGRDADPRAFLGPGRANLVSADTVEDRFGCAAAEPVSTADEQQLHS